MNLSQAYNREDFLGFLDTFLPDFEKDIRPVNLDGLKDIIKASSLGKSNSLDLQIFQLSYKGSSHKRITLTKEGFSIMRQYGIFKALIIYLSEDNEDWRLSLMTAAPEFTEKGKVSLSYSNPKRLSFFLGPNAKINTPTKFLISNGKITDFEDLKNRFSLEVVNKEFYKEISKVFLELVDGLLKLPSTEDKSQTNLEFAVRLIGRIIFCWFLREKRSQTGLALIPKELLSLEAVIKNEDYYHKILEPIFFEVLNKQVKFRRDDLAKESFSSIPYLNGGLFSPQYDDFYKRANGDLQSQHHNTLVIPDNWLKDFFEILETYNFTIDENTSYDEELSIDPEMLGRIFENLLAEINPETGESARKSTGSYYTPRTVVNYMVDESLLLYLKEQTKINEEKLRAIISYDLNDDLTNPLTVEEKEKIIDALEKVKILDPACGSGAFPIGALQKIVFILQQTDPDGLIWKNRQLHNSDPEFRHYIEIKFSNNEIDFLRKLTIIRKSIYGIDIQPIATEISRLRCFLTLIVDEEIKDGEENRGIRPLPNLDFKFVTANSLIGLPQSNNNVQTGLFEDTENINKLSEIRNAYFTATDVDRIELKNQFIQTQNNMLHILISEHRPAELTQQLATWEPFTHRASSWFDPEWMFGIKEGFDIIIANPPYITISLGKGQTNFTKDEIEKLNSIYKDVKEYKNNIFVYFMSLALGLLSKNGQINYIVPNVLLYNKNFSKIRNLLLNKTQIEIIIDVKDKVFESAEIGGNCIFLSSNNPSQEYLTRTCIVKDIKGFENIKYEKIDSNTYKKTKYNKLYLEKTKLELLEKLDKESLLLGSLTQFYNGIKTGDNANFLSSKKINDSYKVVYRGRDIHKYFFDKPSTYVLFDKDKLWSNSNEEFLGKKPKILIRQTSDCLIAALEEEGLYHMDTTHSMFNTKIDILFLLCLLNSKLLDWWHKNYTSEEGRAFAEVKISTLKETPIKNISKDEQKPFIKIVENILELTKSEDYLKEQTKQAKVKDYEAQIDQMVYKLYGLTSEEIKIVESQNNG